MKLLSFPQLQQKISAFKPVSALFSAVLEGKFPLEIEGPEGALGGLLLAELFRSAPGLYFAVVPQESDAADLALDLQTAEVPCPVFPWWGAAPYNELPPLSAVFAERTKALCDLAAGAGGL